MENRKILIVSAGNEEIFNFALPIGIGLIESSINLTRHCLFDKPDMIIFIGTVGSYGNYKIFDVVESAAASNIEHCMLKKECYTPIDNIIVSRETPIINSSNYITTDKIVSKAYIKLGIELENMEFFSVMKVAKEFNIAINGIFVVTNYCNKNAHKDYLKNIQKAKKILINYLKNKGLINENR